MIRTYTITNDNTDAVAAGIQSQNIAETIRPWFAGDYDTEAEVMAQITELQERVSRGEYYGDQETYLGVRVSVDD